MPDLRGIRTSTLHRKEASVRILSTTTIAIGTGGNGESGSTLKADLVLVFITDGAANVAARAQVGRLFPILSKPHANNDTKFEGHSSDI